MTRLVLKIFDYLRSHRKVGMVAFLLITALLVLLVARIEYREDISDFLPLKGDHGNELLVYQNITKADVIVLSFQTKDGAERELDEITDAIDDFVELLQAEDSAQIVGSIMAEIDIDTLTDVASFIYDNIPYFLTKDDYTRIDSLLAEDGFIEEQLRNDKQMLMLPSGGLLAENIQRDPLNLFTPVLMSLSNTGTDLQYETYDGYIFTPDMERGLVVINSPFGANETKGNTELYELLRRCGDETTALHSDVEIHIFGAPIIAVGNAERLKKDSLVAVTCAMLLILALLFYAFRNVRNLVLIAVSVGWGALFGLAFLSIFDSSISMIVIAISSVVIGIAVNYPLHLIAHLSHTPDRRTMVREIVAPLLVGNITTVGAFLALVPLRSVALRDLGLFSSFLLIGTIIFVLIILPHIAKSSSNGGNGIARSGDGRGGEAGSEVCSGSGSGNENGSGPDGERHGLGGLFSKVGEIRLENRPIIVWAIIILTIIFGYYSLQTKFDANMSNINYMTEELQEDFEYFRNNMMREDALEKVYVISTGVTIDEALEKSSEAQPHLAQLQNEGIVTNIASCTRFLTSAKEQEERLEKWNNFIATNGEKIKESLAQYGTAEGFSSGSFDDFLAIMERNYETKPIEDFQPLTQSIFAGYLSIANDGRYNVVDILSLDREERDNVEEQLEAEGLYCFDLYNMNNYFSISLSNDFNYIGWACGCIVFFFLWLSLGSIELAILSFIPMAVSWLWILGLMVIFDIQFNVVTVILGTFIFGQGDDYTIFMTEGSCFEYAYRRKILSSYKNAIILSALIMFIGIGVLILGKHPVMRSLSEVTIMGMLSVVLMAYIFPPLIYRWLVSSGSGASSRSCAVSGTSEVNGAVGPCDAVGSGIVYRTRPLSLRPMLRMLYCTIVFFIELITVYIFGFILFVILKKTEKRSARFHRYVQRLYTLDLNNIPRVKLDIINPHNEDFSEPAVVICNHQSMLDSALFMMLSTKCILVSNSHVSTNRVISKIYKWLDFVTLSSDVEADMQRLQELVAKGYSIVLFPEGERNPDSSILRFHKGAFYLAEKLGLEIIPIIIHGLNYVLPRNSISLFRGKITISIGDRVSTTNGSAPAGEHYQELTKQMHAYYVREYAKLAKSVETTSYYHDFIIDRYRYKGYDISHTVVKNLNRYNNYSEWIDREIRAEETTFDVQNLESISLADTAPLEQKEQISPKVYVIDSGYGEFALMFALVHPEAHVTAIMSDSDNATILKYSAEKIVKNLTITVTHK